MVDKVWLFSSSCYICVRFFFEFLVEFLLMRFFASGEVLGTGSLISRRERYSSVLRLELRFFFVVIWNEFVLGLKFFIQNCILN